MIKTKLKLNEKQYTYLYKWEVEKPIAVLQLVHGSKENIFRYEEFISFLNKKNISVFAIDLRGHGQAALEQKQFGNMGANAFNNLIDDVEVVSKLIKKAHPKLPYTIYGHSMGSFVVRAHSIRYGAPQYILSGTNEETRLNICAGLTIGKLTKLFKGKNKPNKLIDNMSYKSFCKKFRNEKHILSWMSNDPKVKDEFLKDKLNATTFTNESFIGMLKLLKFIRKNKSYKNIKAKKILLVAGDKDPVGNMGKGPKKVNAKMKKKNINAKLILYENGRHEIHNDKNKKTVHLDLANFIIGKK